MKKIKQLSKTYIIVGLFAAGMIAPFAFSMQAQALECSILPPSICGGAEAESKNIQDTAIWDLLILVVNILTAGVALTAVGGIVYGGILYTTSSGSPEQVKKAKTILVNVTIGIVAFALMYSLLQWLIPGGAFNNVS